MLEEPPEAPSLPPEAPSLPPEAPLLPPEAPLPPELSLSREAGCYVLEGDLVPEPLKRYDRVDAICALVAELIRAYVRQDDSLLCLHGAAAAFAGKLVVFPSQYRAGKSILSACLAAAGVPLFCDDVLPIERATGRGIAPGLALRLRKPLPDNLAEESLRFMDKHSSLEGEHYKYLRLDERAMASRGRVLPIGAFVLLERKAGSTTILEDASEADVLRQVIWQNFAREAEAPQILDVLNQLVSESRCFRLHYDRAEDAAWLLQQEFKAWPELSPREDFSQVLSCGSIAVDSNLAPGQYMQKPGISIVETEDQIFLADREGSAIHHLNLIGSSIWALLAEPIEREEIVTVLNTAFPNLETEQIERDVSALIDEFKRKNLLEHYGT